MSEIGDRTLTDKNNALLDFEDTIIDKTVISQVITFVFYR